jgi:sialate O-acetylesterase
MPALHVHARRALPAALVLLLALPAQAAVRLPAILSDHMVVQRAERVPVWGWADPGETVTVEMGSQRQQTRAGDNGRWRIDLDLRQAPAAPTSMTVRGADQAIVIEDVLVGEVWLASGQSNMEKPLGEQRGQKPTFDAAAEIAAASYPGIRLFKVKRKKAGQPLDDVAGAWVGCAPETIDAIKFSAAAYFFGQRLHKELGTAVGLIDATWGGTRIEPWTPVRGDSASGSGALAGATGSSAAGSGANNDAPGQLFNGMIAGLAPHALRGVIWYQGESNILDTDDGPLYAPKMEALVGGWRGHWQRDFPFYYVQVAPHLYHVLRQARVGDAEAAPRLWEAQADALRIPGTGMIVTTDLVDDLFDIHPRDKKNIGLRLANLALKQTYGRKEIVASGPVFRALAIEGSQAVVSFDHGEGLAARDGKPLTWFSIAGSDGRYHPASAAIKDDKVVVASPRVPAPVAVRFGWDEAAQPNLVNGAGLPARPFRSLRPATPQTAP